jgi:hypothetical protein
VQKRSRDHFQKLSPIENEQAAREYVNFYAYLHTVVDQHISALLDTLEESGLADDRLFSGSPTMARAGCHTACARRPTPWIRK